MAEVMVAVLFVTIAMFAYVSLHMRLIHSGRRLDVKLVDHKVLERMTVREISQVMNGQKPANAYREEIPRSEESEARIFRTVSEHPTYRGLYHVRYELERQDRFGARVYPLDTYETKTSVGW